MTELQTTPPKVPLAYAASVLADICNVIDEGGEINDALEVAFHNSKLDLADAVARRVCFIKFCGGAIEAAKQARDQWSDRASQLETVLEKVKESTMDVMRENPDLPYTSDIGRLAIQKNSMPSIELAKGLDPSMHTRIKKNLEGIEEHGVEERFLQTTEVKYLNMDTIKKALEAGEALKWATRKLGSHLRIRV